MATYLGAAADLRPEELSAEMFRGYSIFYTLFNISSVDF
jgi:hypothetical protein